MKSFLTSRNKAHLAGLVTGFVEWLGGGLSVTTGMPEELAAGVAAAIGWVLIERVPNWLGAK